MLFSQQQDYNPRDIYQPSSMSYGAGIFKPQNQQPYHNQQPRTRAERDYLKEVNSQQAVMQSRQFDTPQKEDMKALLHSPAPNTTLFQQEQERFLKDFAAQDKQQREYQNKQKQLQYESRRLANLEREGMIWQRNELHQQKDELKRQYHQEQFTQGKRNLNGLAYNPLTLEYAQNEQGQALKRQDEMTQVRQLVRAQNLDNRANCGYNLLTGENRKGVEEIVPDDLRGHYQNKMQERDNQLNIKHYALQQQLLSKQY
ncbi:unnamed protein product [Paramecium pentaurelia]|uniref:Uncharacterized protein n=1 Tax=Paramecium pentaurelia TaxID=43138 RepID=A0A8S1UDV0_9CILI|nr:unnamed protein product [Paramecium pentaurelia]